MLDFSNRGGCFFPHYVGELRRKEKTRFAFIKNYVTCFDIICYINMFNKYTYLRDHSQSENKQY